MDPGSVHIGGCGDIAVTQDATSSALSGTEEVASSENSAVAGDGDGNGGDSCSSRVEPKCRQLDGSGRASGEDTGNWSDIAGNTHRSVRSQLDSAEPSEVDGGHNEVVDSERDISEDEHDDSYVTIEESSSSSSCSSTFSLHNDHNTPYSSSTRAVDPDMHADAQTVSEILSKPAPAHTWFLMDQLLKRQQGGDRQFGAALCGSLYAVQRLHAARRLEHHAGCVNCVSFADHGELLACGSDDLHVSLWRWQDSCTRPLVSFDTGHTSNVFDARFVSTADHTSWPLHVVTTSRDGQVREAVLGEDGSCRSTRRLAKHERSGRKLALPAHCTNTVLSCGGDGAVFSIDLRQSQPHMVVVCRTCVSGDGGRGRGRSCIVSTNSIAAHPRLSHLFAVACEDTVVRLYDRRHTTSPLNCYSPSHLRQKSMVFGVTSCAFNHDGSRLIGSYTDDVIYMFDSGSSTSQSRADSPRVEPTTRQSAELEPIARFSGHTNRATIKGVNFFGPRSQYVVSGSDCGHVFFWHADSGAIVHCARGDDTGVVNCLEPHPWLPVMATSGLDHDVKLWSLAGHSRVPDKLRLEKIVGENVNSSLVNDEFVSRWTHSDLMHAMMRRLLDRELHRDNHSATRMTDDDDTSSSDNDQDEGVPECRTM